MKKILIVIPIYINNDLHLEFTEKTLDSIHHANHDSHDYDVLCIVNYKNWLLNEEIEELDVDEIIYRDKNVLSAAWNQGIKYGIDKEYDYIFVTNNDIIYHADAFENILKFAEEHKEFDMWTCAEWKGASPQENSLAANNYLEGISMGDGFDEHPHFSAFMVSPNTVEKLASHEEGTKEPFPGLFDEGLAPAYFEDGDMHQRFIRAGMKAAKTATAIFYHYGSRTIKTDPKLDRTNVNTYEKNRRYFWDKWGFDPHNSVVESDDPKRFAYKGAFEPNEDN